MRIFLMIRLCCVIFTFSSLAMNHAPRLASQALFDIIAYPATPGQNTIFENAKKILKKDIHNQDALYTLVALANDVENPHVPAMRQLASIALTRNNFNDAFEWSAKGAMINDPACALTHAALLDHPELVPAAGQIDLFTREKNIQNLLLQASRQYTIPLSHSSDIDDMVFYLPHAQDALSHYQSYYQERSHSLYEDALSRCTPQQLSEIHENARKNISLPAGCFFLKKFLHGDNALEIPCQPEHAMDWAELIINDIHVDYDYFTASGAYAALQEVAHGNDLLPLQARANFLLGLLHYCEAHKNPQLHYPLMKNYLCAGAAYDPRALLLLSRRTGSGENDAQHYKQCVTRVAELSTSEQIAYIPLIIDTFAKKSFDHDYALLDAVTALFEKQEYQDFKKSAQFNGDLAYQIGCALWNIKTNAADAGKEYKRHKQKIRDQALACFEHARLNGNLEAAWKVLCYGQVGDSTHVVLDMAIACTEIAAEDQKIGALMSDALENLEKNAQDAQLHVSLASLYQNGLGSTRQASYLQPNEQKAFVHAVCAGVDGIDFLIEKSERMQDPLLCLKAAQHLLAQKDFDNNPAFTAAVKAYFTRAFHGDQRVKEEMIRYCLKQDVLFDYALQTTRAYCSSAAGQKESNADFDFINAIIPIFIDKAHNNADAAVLMNHILTTYPTFITDNIPNKEVLAEYFLEKAADLGNFEALVKISSRSHTIAPNVPEYSKAARSWYQLWKSCGDKVERNGAKQHAYRVMEVLVNAWDAKVAEGAFINDPEFNYYAMMMFADANPRFALNRFNRAEDAVGNLAPAHPQVKNLIVETGAKACLEACARQDKGWAYYALAVATFIRNSMQFLERDVFLEPKKNIKCIKETRELIRKAQSASEPFTEFATVTETELEYSLGVQHENLAVQSTGSDDEEYFEKAFKHYERAASKGHFKAQYSWAMLCLQGRGDTGQAALEKSIEYIIRAAKAGHAKALVQLSEIYTQGFTFIAGCAGCMNNGLRSTMEEAIDECFKGRNVSIAIEVPQVPVAEPADPLERAMRYLEQSRDYERAYELFHQEALHGNCRAMAYLGLMHRDGIFVQQSAEQAKDYFIKSLMAWRNTDGEAISVLNIGFESLRESQDARAQVARAKFMFGLALNAHGSDLRSVFKDLEKAEELALASTNEQEQNLVFTSDLAQLVNELYKKEKSKEFLLEILSLYLQRIVHLGLPQDKQHLQELMLPFIDLKEMLRDRCMSKSRDNFFCDEIIPLLGNLTKKLELAIGKGYLEPLRAILGLLHIRGLVENTKWADLKTGMDCLNKSCEEDADMLLVRGVINLSGNTFCDKIPRNIEAGKNILQNLSSQGNVGAMVILGKWFFKEKNDIKSAEKYLRDAIEKDSNNPDANFTLAKIYMQRPALVKNNYKIIAGLLKKAAAKPRLMALCQMYIAYLAVAKDPEILETKAISGMLQQSLSTTFESDDLKSEILLLSMDKQFHESLSAWAKGLQEKSITEEQENITNQAFCTVGWWYMALARAKTLSKKDALQEYITARTMLEVAIQNKQKPINALILLGQIYLNGYGVQRNLNKVKFYITLTCAELQKKNLTLEHVPHFKKLLEEFKICADSSYGDVQQSGLVILQPGGIEKALLNIKFIDAILKKFGGATE